MNIKGLLKEAQKSIKANSPEILLGLGIAGMVTSTIFAIKATPKALQLIEEETEKKGEELTGKEIGKTVWKCYIPTVGMTAVSVACLIGGNRIKSKRALALYSAYEISKASFQTYKDGIVEKIGEKKAKEIENDITDKQIEEAIKINNLNVNKTDRTLFYENHHGEFYATLSDLELAVIKANNYMMQRGLDGYICVGDVYDLMGLDDCGDYGVEKGFNFRDGLIELNKEADINDNGVARIKISFKNKPTDTYDLQYL